MRLGEVNQTLPIMKSTFQLFARLVCAIAILSVGGALSSCKTVKGFGRDVEKLGSKIEEKADENTRY